MANILILTLVFPPDGVSTAQILGDLSLDLKKRNHNIVVVTSTPHYNRDREAEERQPRRRLLGRIIQKSTYNDIPVFHIFMPRKSSTPFFRILSWFWFHLLSSLFAILIRYDFDIVLAISPPLTIGLSAHFISIIRGIPFIYNVQEIYPDYAIKMGYLRNGMLKRFLYRLEYYVYSRADAISVIAPYMAKNLENKQVSHRKLSIIPNFVDTSYFKPVPDNDKFKREMGLQNKFIVSYAGNIGPGQDLDNLIDTAEVLSDQSEIHFLIIGDGMLRDKIINKIKIKNLRNVTYLRYQPYSVMPLIYSISDLCLVPQNENVAGTAVPSKVFRIMACARPVLAVASPQSDLSDLVNESRSGIVVEAGSSRKLAAEILNSYLHRENLYEMGIAGRDYVERYYSREAITSMYDKLIDSVISKRIQG